MEETGAARATRAMGTMRTLRIAVVMQRLPLDNRWQPWQWRPLEIVEMDASSLPDQAAPRCLLSSDAETRWLFGGFEVELFRDEAEGYFLNVDSPQPCWFIMWRMEEHDGEADAIAVPKTVTLSYNEAARLMDGGERVEILPAPPHIVGMMQSFVDEYYRPEAKGKRRKPSFEGGAGVDAMARAEQDINRGS